ncbi:MAG: ribosomal protection-like ABC-F family protein [Thermomicrobiales bacterium]
MTLLIQAANIRQAHGGNQIFEDVSFEVRTGDRFALIGANGAGKSTLFKIMAKRTKPDGGAVTHQRGLRFGLLDQESTLDPALTVRDVVALAAGDADALEAKLRELEARMAEPLDDDELTAVMDAHAETLQRVEESGGATGEESPGFAVLAGLRLPEERWDTPIGRLSGGEKKIVALAKMLIDKPDVLLLDEPDNHLDLAAKSWLERYLATQAGAVAVITHDRYFIDRMANKIFELEDGKIEVYPGNYSAYVDEKRRRRERALQLRELQEREFKKLKASAEQLTQWARQNPKFATRAENQRRKMTEERERLDSEAMPSLSRRQLDVEFDTERGGTLVVQADRLSKRYGERDLMQPFELLVRHGERVGLVGPNGAGKTTLFRILLGHEKPTTGSVRIGAAVVVGYYAQEHETLDLKQTPIEFVRQRKPISEQQALGFLNGLLFDRTDALNEIGRLSGGEKARLQIGALILEGANLLLLDEPTNNLDISSVQVLEAALSDFDGTIVAISHDRYFLDTFCTRTVEIDDGIVRNFPGGHSFYEGNPEKGKVLTLEHATTRARRP